MSTDPLFGPPPPSHPPDPTGLPHVRPDGTILGGLAKWTDFKQKHRPCDWCVLAIHQGLMRTHPYPARRRRIGPNDNATTGPVLCIQHAERQETRDHMAARDAADARAHTEHAKRRTR